MAYGSLADELIPTFAQLIRKALSNEHSSVVLGNMVSNHKSIVRITLMKEEPQTSWSTANPREYGFYSNVNPNVDHPRWSQATERRISTSFVAKRRPTLLFNGYEKEVSDLYRGMDLTKLY